MNPDFPNVDTITTVPYLFDPVTPVFADANCVDVLDRFLKDKDLLSVPIVDQLKRPVGMVTRPTIMELFITPLAREYSQRRAISEIMDPVPVSVDADASIDEIIQKLVDRDFPRAVSDYVLTKHGAYLGIGTIHSLLKEIFRSRNGGLYSLAYYDSLTGLPNRLLFRDRLLQACQNVNRNGSTFALIFVDLDHFKRINDTHGHVFGDLLLKSVARRLLESLRESDTVARLAGDEFVIILNNSREPRDVARVCGLLIDKLNQPLSIHSHQFEVSASLGIAICPHHDQTPDGLMRKADSAMYDAKRAGRNRYAFYSDHSRAAQLERFSLAPHLKRALDNDELILFYQPIIRLSTNEITGVEALLRWQHPEFGIISPLKFIPIAEENGMIEMIGEWVLKKACAQHCSWVRQGLPPLRVSVNISPTEYETKTFCDTVEQIVSETGIDPSFLELEPTERMLMNSSDKTIDRLLELRKIGIKISIDDFGIGYSSLRSLRRFRIDRIKIDQSFIHHIDASSVNRAIVRSITMLGTNLGLDIVAEGVETESELECIKCHACHHVQGNVFARPVPPSDFGYWFQNRVSLPQGNR